MPESGMASLGILEISPHTTSASLHSRNVSHASALKSFAHIVLNPARSNPKSRPPAPQNRLTAVNAFFVFAIQHGRVETHPLQVRARIAVAGHHAKCIKRERIFLSMHSAKARPKAHLEYMEKENALKGAHLHSHAVPDKIFGRILAERLVSVDAKLSILLAEVGGFLPPYRFLGRRRNAVPTLLALSFPFTVFTI